MEDRGDLLVHGLAEMLARMHNPDEPMIFAGLTTLADRIGIESLHYMRR